MVSTFDMKNPGLLAHKFTFPPQEVGHNLYSFSLDLADGSNGPVLQMQTAASANL